MRKFEQALGQYKIYRDLLEMNALDYDLYLAIDKSAIVDDCRYIKTDDKHQ